MRKIEQKVLKFINEKRLLNKGDKVLVALSGGPDSVFLLYFMSKFRQKYSIELGAVHINHMIRGKSAFEDEEFCRKLSVNLNIDFSSVRKNVKSFAKQNKFSIEEAGRIIRYKEFDRLLKQRGYNKVATAHNCTDNAETVLLNLIKGTGIRGISGIPAKRGNIVRPILSLKKEEILEYLNNYGIKYRIDESNLQTEYERNFLRNDIIPLIKKKLNPEFDTAIFHSAEIFSGLSDYLDSRVNEKIKAAVRIDKEGLKISTGEFNELDDELKNYLIKSVVEEKFKSQLTFNDIKNINSLFTKKSGTSINLADKLVAAREREYVIFFYPAMNHHFNVLYLAEGKSVKINNKTLFIKQVLNAPMKYSGDKLREYISADKITGNFQIRRWEAGDKFLPLGLKGTKKISDFLNEQKITSSKKKEQLILTNNERIVWVLGLRIDERFKITENTKKVLELCLK
jgi:tRNA(Ile)-lysidine synthase